MAEFGGAFAALDAHVRRLMDFHRTPGLALAVTDRAGPIKVSAYGLADIDARTPITPDTLFEIGSIGKTFTAIAVMQAHEAGLVDLHAPVTEYLPWFRIRTEFEPITLHHLLTHTAGLIEGTDFAPDGKAEVWGLRETETGFAPGEHCYYSNVGYKVLGYVLQSVMGKSYGEVIAEGILRPAGMGSTEPEILNRIRPRLARGYRHLYDDRPPHAGHPLVPTAWLETDTGDGSIASTAEDMAAFARLLLNRGRVGGGAVLSEKSFDLLTSRLAHESGEWYYGYGVYAYRESGVEYLAHGGDMPGYEASLWCDLDSGLGLVALMTTPGVRRLAFPALQLLRAATKGEPLPELPAPPDPACLEEAADYEGVYACGEKSLEVHARGENLVLGLYGRDVLLESRGEDRFYANDPEFNIYLLSFGRGDEDGAGVIEVVYGPDVFVREGAARAADPDCPREWRAYTGHYRSHDPWLTNFRVILRKGHLFIVDPSGSEEPLFALDRGRFRIGEQAFSPERIAFDQIAAGEALRADRSGCYYYRFFTP
jgi:CubicO group peptidase (beta-lactamase class C family)